MPISATKKGKQMEIPEAMKFIESNIKMALSIKKCLDEGDDKVDGFIDAHRLAYRALQKMRDSEDKK